MGIEFSAKPETPQLIQIDIPAELASVEEFWEAPARPNPKMILQIQNAHTNYEAQTKIRDLMSYLNQNYGFKTIFVEGASEELNPEYLKLFPDAETNRRLWDELAKRGQITGADWFLLNDEKSGAKGVGIENAELYKKNYEALKAVYSREAETAKFVGGLESELDKLASKTLPPETRKIIAEWKKFEKGHREFIPFVESLSKLAKQTINLDLKALYSQIEWPQMTRILVLQEMEKKLEAKDKEQRTKREAAETEKKQMLSWLKANGVSSELITGLERFNEKDINMNRIRASSGKMESLPRFFVEKLVEEAGPKGLKFSDYPNFALYTGYLILRYEIEPTALFEEIRKLFEKLLEPRTTEQEPSRKLIELFKDAELIRKLLNLELSRGEWGTVLARKAEIEPSRIFERVKNVAEGTKSPDQRAKTLTEYQKQIQTAFENAFSFYDLAIKRDDVFYKKMAKALETTDRAILMTGGFHTEGLREIFREKEISYGTITPRLTQIEKSNLYREVMLGKSNFSGQRPKVDDQTVEIWSLLNQTGLTPDSARFSVERISAAIYEATNGKSFDGKAIANHLNSGLFGKENFKVDYNGRNFEVVARSEARIPNLATEAEFDAKAINPELFQKGNEAVSAGNYDQAIVSYYQFLKKLKSLLTSGISLIALDDAEKAARKNLKLAILGKMNLFPAGDEKVLYVFHGHKTIQPVIANGIIAHKEKLGYRGGDGYYTTTYPHSALGYAGYTFDPASLVAFPHVYQAPVDPAVVIVAIRGYDETTIPKIDFDALSREASRRSIVEDRDGKEILEELITEQIGEDAPAYKLIYKMSDGGEGDILDGGGDEIVIRDPSILNSSNMTVVSPEKILSPEAMNVLGVPSPKITNVPAELKVDMKTFPKMARSESRTKVALKWYQEITSETPLDKGARLLDPETGRRYVVSTAGDWNTAKARPVWGRTEIPVEGLLHDIRYDPTITQPNKYGILLGIFAVTAMTVSLATLLWVNYKSPQKAPDIQSAPVQQEEVQPADEMKDEKPAKKIKQEDGGKKRQMDGPVLIASRSESRVGVPDLDVLPVVTADVARFHDQYLDNGLDPAQKFELSKAAVYPEFLTRLMREFDDIAQELPIETRVEPRLYSVGLGNGVVEARLKEKTYRVGGVEASAVQAANARNKGINVAEGDAHQIMPAVPAESVDMVFIGEAIGYLRVPTILDQAKRMLSQDGLIVISTYPVEPEEAYQVSNTGYRKIPVERIQQELVAAGFEMVGAPREIMRDEFPGSEIQKYFKRAVIQTIVVARKKAVRSESRNLPDFQDWIEKGTGTFEITASDGDVFNFGYSKQGEIAHLIEVHDNAGAIVGSVYFSTPSKDKPTKRYESLMLRSYYDHLAVLSVDKGLSDAIKVSEEWREKYSGIGSALISLAMRLSQKIGVKQFQAWAVDSDAKGFYENVGFQNLVGQTYVFNVASSFNPDFPRLEVKARSESRLEKFVQTAKVAAVGSVGVVSGIAAGAVFFALMPAFSSLLFPITLAGVVFLSLSKALKYKQFLQTDGAAESKSVRAWIGKEMKSDFDRILRQLNLLVFSEDLRVESGFVDIALANIRNGIHFLIELVFSGPAMPDLEPQIRTVTRTFPRADSAPMGQRSESRDISRRDFLSKGIKALAGVAILNPVSAGAQSVTDLDRRSRQVELTQRLIKYFEGYTSEDLKKAAVERERKNPLNFSDVSVKLTEILNAVVPSFGDTDVDRAQRDQAIHDIKNMLLIILSIESGNLEYLIQRKWTKPTKENLIPEHQPIYVAVGPFQIEIGPHSSFTGQDLLLSFLQYGKGQGFSGEARGLLHDYLARKMGLLAANQEGGNEIKQLLEQLDFPRGLPEKATPEEKAAHDAALKASRDKLGLILGRMMIENVDDTGLYFGVLNVLRKLQAPNKESFLARVNEMKADPALFYGVKYRGAAQLADANKKKVEKAMVHLKENRLWTEAPLKEKSATPAAVVQKPLVTPQQIAIDENNLPPYFIDETNPIYSQSDLVAFESNPLKWYLPGLGLLGVYAIFAAVAWNKLTPRLARAMIWISGLIQGLFFAGLLAFIGDYFYNYIFDRSLVESVSLFESIDSVIYLNAISISLFLFNYFGLRKIASQGRQVARSAPEREAAGPRRSEMRAVNGEITAIAYSKRAKNEFEAALIKGELIPQRANTSGANEAVIYEGSRGKWYAKQYNNPDQARAELLSWLIYRQLDIPVAQEMFVSEINGDVFLVSKMMPGDAVWNGYEDSALAAREFVASAFTQDRDRSKPDNYRKYQGQIYALDFGSSAMFRSNGEIKGEGEDQGAFSFSAENFLDMLSIESQHHSKSFFRNLSQDQINRQIAFVAERLTEDDLNQMINAAFIDESSVKEKISKVYEASANELDELAQRFEFAEDTTVPVIRLEAVKQPVLQRMIVALRNAWINFIRLFSHRKANHGDLQRFSAGTKSERVVPVLEALLTKQDASELISQRILEVNRFGSPQLTINPQQLAKWNDMPWYHGFDEAKLDSETGRPILEEIIFGENPGLRPSLVNGVNRPTVARDVRTAKNYVGKEGRDVILAFDAVKARSFLTDPFASIMNASAVVEDSYIPPSALTEDSKKYVITRFPDKTSDELAAALGVTKEWVAQVREDNWLGKLNFDNYGLTTSLSVAAARSEMRSVLTKNLVSRKDPKLVDEFSKIIKIVDDPKSAPAVINSNPESSLRGFLNNFKQNELTPYELDILEFFVERQIPVEYRPGFYQGNDGGVGFWTADNDRGYPYAWFGDGIYRRGWIGNKDFSDMRSAVRIMLHEMSHVMDGIRSLEGEEDVLGYAIEGERRTPTHRLAYQEYRANIWAYQGNINLARRATDRSYTAVNNVVDMFPDDLRAIVDAQRESLRNKIVYRTIELLSRNVNEQIYSTDERIRENLIIAMNEFDVSVSLSEMRAEALSEFKSAVENLIGKPISERETFELNGETLNLADAFARLQKAAHEWGETSGTESYDLEVQGDPGKSLRIYLLRDGKRLVDSDELPTFSREYQDLVMAILSEIQRQVQTDKPSMQVSVTVLEAENDTEIKDYNPSVVEVTLEQPGPKKETLIKIKTVAPVFIQKSPQVGLLTHQGARSENQDQHNYFQIETPIGKALTVMVFDGHGVQGGEVAELLNTFFTVNLTKLLTELQSAEALKQEMTVLFNSAHESLKKVGLDGGSTAAISIVLNGNVYFFTLGDSPIYLINKNNPEKLIEAQSFLDHTDNPDAVKMADARMDIDAIDRISGLGLQVDLKTGRSTGLYNFRGNSEGTIRVLSDFGDYQMEGMGREPKVETYALSADGDYQLIVGSDGILAGESDHESADQIAGAVKNAQTQEDALRGMLKLFAQSSPSDNFTAYAVSLNQEGVSRSEVRSAIPELNGEIVWISPDGVVRFNDGRQVAFKNVPRTQGVKSVFIYEKDGYVAVLKVSKDEIIDEALRNEFDTASRLQDAGIEGFQRPLAKLKLNDAEAGGSRYAILMEAQQGQLLSDIQKEAMAVRTLRFRDIVALVNSAFGAGVALHDLKDSNTVILPTGKTILIDYEVSNTVEKVSSRYDAIDGGVSDSAMEGFSKYLDRHIQSDKRADLLRMWQLFELSKFFEDYVVGLEAPQQSSVLQSYSALRDQISQMREWSEDDFKGWFERGAKSGDWYQSFVEMVKAFSDEQQRAQGRSEAREGDQRSGEFKNRKTAEFVWKRMVRKVGSEDARALSAQVRRYIVERYREAQNDTNQLWNHISANWTRTEDRAYLSQFGERVIDDILTGLHSRQTFLDRAAESYRHIRISAAQAELMIDLIAEGYANKLIEFRPNRSESRQMPEAIWKRDKAPRENIFTVEQWSQIQQKTQTLQELIAQAAGNDALLKLLNYPSFVLFFLGLKPAYLATIKKEGPEPSIKNLIEWARLNAQAAKMLASEKIDFYENMDMAYRGQAVVKELKGALRWLEAEKLISAQEIVAISEEPIGDEPSPEFHIFTLRDFFGYPDGVDVNLLDRRQDALTGLLLGIPLESVQAFDNFVLQTPGVDVAGINFEPIGTQSLEDISVAAQRVDGKISPEINKHMARYYDALNLFYARSETRQEEGQVKAPLDLPWNDPKNPGFAKDVKRIFVTGEYDIGNGAKLGYDAVRFAFLIPALLKRFPNATIQIQGVNFAQMFDHHKEKGRIEPVSAPNGEYQLAIAQHSLPGKPAGLQADYFLDIVNLAVYGGARSELVDQRGNSILEKEISKTEEGPIFWNEAESILKDWDLVDDESEVPLNVYNHPEVGGHQVDWARLIATANESTFFDRKISGKPIPPLFKQIMNYQTMNEIVTGKSNVVYVNLDAVTQEQTFNKAFWVQLLSKVLHANPNSHLMFSGGASPRARSFALNVAEELIAYSSGNQRIFVLPMIDSARLSQVWDFMAISDAVVTPNTGFMHMAHAAGRPLFVVDTSKEFTKHWSSPAERTEMLYLLDINSIFSYHTALAEQYVANLFQKVMSSKEKYPRQSFQIGFEFTRFAPQFSRMIDSMRQAAERSEISPRERAWIDHHNQLLESREAVKAGYEEFKKYLEAYVKELNQGQEPSQIVVGTYDAQVVNKLIAEIEKKVMSPESEAAGKLFLSYMISHLQQVDSESGTAFLKPIALDKDTARSESRVVDLFEADSYEQVRLASVDLNQPSSLTDMVQALQQFASKTPLRTQQGSKNLVMTASVDIATGQVVFALTNAKRLGRDDVSHASLYNSTFGQAADLQQKSDYISVSLSLNKNDRLSAVDVIPRKDSGAFRSKSASEPEKQASAEALRSKMIVMAKFWIEWMNQEPQLGPDDQRVSATISFAGLKDALSYLGSSEWDSLNEPGQGLFLNYENLKKISEWPLQFKRSELRGVMLPENILDALKRGEAADATAPVIAALVAGGVAFAAGEATMQNLQSVASFLSPESSEKWMVNLLELPEWSGNETGVTIELSTQKRLSETDIKHVESVLIKNPASRYVFILMDGNKVGESWIALAKQYPKQFMIELKTSAKIKNGLSKMMDGIGLKPVQVTGLQEALLGYQSSLKGLLGVRDTRSIVINPEDDQASYHLVRIAKTIVAGQASGIDQLPQDEIRIFEPDSKDGNVWNIRKGALAQLAKIVLEIQAQAKAAISA